MSISRGGSVSALLSELQFTSPDGGTITGYYLTDEGLNCGDGNGGAYFTLNVSDSALSVLPNVNDAIHAGARIVVTGTVYQWVLGSDGADVGDYTDATAFGDAMPTSTFLNLGRVAY